MCHKHITCVFLTDLAAAVKAPLKGSSGVSVEEDRFVFGHVLAFLILQIVLPKSV